MEQIISVNCKHCKVKGLLIIRKDTKGDWEIIKDKIKHKRGCELRPAQPQHLSNRKKWQQGEKRGNDLVGAKETVVSGALNKDGDGRLLNKWRVETKTTEKESYRLYESIWDKLHDGAMSNAEEPLFYIETSEARFVIVRRALNLPLDLTEKEVKGKSIAITNLLAFELNNNNAQLLSSWKGSPVILLANNFNKEGIYER